MVGFGFGWELVFVVYIGGILMFCRLCDYVVLGVLCDFARFDACFDFCLLGDGLWCFGCFLDLVV